MVDKKAALRSLSAVKSADRVLDIFELLSGSKPYMSHTELVAALRVPKSSLTQLLRNLVAREYVAIDPATKSYRLGPKFTSLVRDRRRDQEFLLFAAEALKTVTETTRESAALNLLRDSMAEVVLTSLSPHRLVSHMRLGDRAPLYATSSGKIFLAFMTPDAMTKYLADNNFERITPKTVQSRTAIKEQLTEIRRIKVAYSFEEFTHGIIGIAVPVVHRSGEIMGAMNIAIPSVRYSESARKKAVQALRMAAEYISLNMPN